MKKQISKYDFRFRPSGFGQYDVTYNSPATRKSWTAEKGNGLDKDDEAWAKDKFMLAYLVLNI